MKVKNIQKLAVCMGIALVVSMTFSCRPKKDIVALQISVQEEGGFSFTQITSEDQKIYSNFVSVNASGQLIWNSLRSLDISPDSSNIAYVSGNTGSDVFVKSLKSGKSITQKTYRNSVNNPSYSPDGKYIVFHDNSDGNSNIYLINSNAGSAIQQISSSSSDETQPVFSKDGKLIYFVKREFYSGSHKYNIWSYNRDNSQLTQYSEGFNPCPIDQDRLLVTRANKINNRGEIWILNVATGDETLIISDNKIGFSNPRISPNGKEIIVVGSTPKTENTVTNLNLYTVKIDGSELTQITFHPSNDMSPVWSVDGKYVYFVSARGNAQGKLQIWRIKIN